MIAHWEGGRLPGDLWSTCSTKFDPYCFQQVAWTSAFTCLIYFKDSEDVHINGTAPSSLSAFHLSLVPHKSTVITHRFRKYTISSLYMQSSNHKVVWRSFETLLDVLRKHIWKTTSICRLNIPRLVSGFACPLPPLVSSHRSWEVPQG